jgi:uncharacterized membrane protein YhaH (DUF805 family)
MKHSYRAFWLKSFALKGKTTRADFWIVAVVNAIILVILLSASQWLIALFGDSAWAQVLRGAFWRLCDWLGLAACGRLPVELVVLYLLATIIPSFTIQVRRLRDVGLNPLLLLIGLIPYAGGIILFLLYLQPSKGALSGR